jgi:putative ABC transport system permease protein
VVIQVVVSLLVPPAAGLLPILSGSRTSVHKAISGGGLADQGTLRRSLLDRALHRIRWLSRPLLISLRNTFRRKGRLALTLATLTLGGAVFMPVQHQVALNTRWSA